jgi:hypothetical protein
MPGFDHFDPSQLLQFCNVDDARVCLAVGWALHGSSRETILEWDDLVKRGDVRVYLV